MVLVPLLFGFGVDNYAEGGEHFEETEFLNQEPLTAEANLEDEEMLEFVFNKDVITTLSYNFGSSGFPLDMADVCCPVKLPMRLVRELHSYWMDSVEEYLSQEKLLQIQILVNLQ
ncbi:hypothetical protein LSTR_LSTR015288 [Laodelphax striatellus]|uniref:Uncharacterized protein n=1 Tax=Laodelphax striatellus TaxID=195883 RepID=A0A482WT73_LAOST|nr:hypothetical protein LSTR_LSTR015288 [Laodelphax striatellus]